MPVVTPPLITPLPAPPDPNDRATFNALAYPWASSLNGLTTQVAAVAANIVLNANDAASSTIAATTQAALATTNGAAQVTLAAGQVTLATTQAQNAATSAATSSTQAGISTAQAAISTQKTQEVAAVQAAINGFQQTYLGAKAGNPAVDNLGAALIPGAWYFNTTINKIRVFSGSVWTEPTSAVNGTSSRVSYTATAGQVTFSVPYDIGFVDVYLNGIKQVLGGDFTATNGTSISLIGGATVGDTVDLVAYGSFLVANTYSRPEIDALRVNSVTSVNGATGAVVLALLRNVAYDNRASLRALSPANGDAAIVTGLGLFVWESASTEPDDDESAFATASGVWLLQAASWDLVDSWSLVDEQAQEDDDEDEPLRFAASFAAKVLTGSATCAVTSVGTGNSVSFTGTVTGAAIGDRVVATPPAPLGSNSFKTGQLSFHAFVSAANTVTIVLTNASAGDATTNPLVQATWPVTVIKT